jgi:hypothetical protein
VLPVSDGNTHAFAVVFTDKARHWTISASKLSPTAALRIDFGDLGESISPRYTRCRISAYGGSRFAHWSASISPGRIPAIPGNLRINRSLRSSAANTLAISSAVATRRTARVAVCGVNKSSAGFRSMIPSAAATRLERDRGARVSAGRKRSSDPGARFSSRRNYRRDANTSHCAAATGSAQGQAAYPDEEGTRVLPQSTAGRKRR